MSLETNGFEFDEFLLDTKEKVLLRQGKPVPITPKTFQLLLALVENHGRLVEKDELMRSVWADSFVEAGNLAFTMRLLRKALADDRQNPRFIETVPRRGYRFIAEVKELTAEKNGSNNDSPPTIEKSVDEISPAAAASGFKKLAFPVLALLIVGVILAGIWFVRSKNTVAGAPVLHAPFASAKLSTNGKVSLAAISPDGKNVVYTNTGNSRTSVWVRQLEADVNTEIIPPLDEFYGGLTFSPDGNFLYFSRRPTNYDVQFDIYRVPIFGGVPTKIVSETQGWISLSPGSDKISFVRCYWREDEFCSLWAADAADGKNEKKLVSRPKPIRIGDNKISPDGLSIVFANGQSENASNEFNLSEVEIESGKERELTPEKFFNVKNMQWLPDGSGLLVTAARVPTKHFLIWHVARATGKAEPLTKDSETYSVLSLDKSASRLVSTQIKQDFQLRLFKLDNPSAAKILADASTAKFAPDGKIVFSSIMSGNDEIWSIEPDGSGQRQLTNNQADDARPVVSPDGNSIFFISNRSGQAHVWRMGADGSNPAQITQEEGGFPITVSPDGRWIYYHHGRNRALWRASTAGGEEHLVLTRKWNYFSLSPDASLAACYEIQGEERLLAVVSLVDGRTVKTFHLGDRSGRLEEIAWFPDGKNLLYTTTDRKYENNTVWRQSLDGGEPQQITNLGNEEVNFLTVSPDGKSFAVVQGGWRHDAVLLKGLR